MQAIIIPSIRSPPSSSSFSFIMISSGFVVRSVEYNWPISALRSALSSPLLDTVLVENVTSSTGDAGRPIIDNSGALRGEDGGGVTMPGCRLIFHGGVILR